ncbi:hypothetical protein V495_02805 [Pseudogymnoascus sp. VKM F-4514 (FW-929)]|nr:hypothetical protein V490_07181 [Pseudogymnoascus sp. VKM F-3557]KFY45819.1 hypothetical protein V495_02805 [Pseudogymnoascus sp. VKM F-4514 (FW-929)]KFY51212.1 hypothetical protein V497_09325 [Pseudogymnoascus sp. VKM F-4516 (FW-969)]
MTTSFTTLPIVSLSALSEPHPDPTALSALSSKLNEVFSTTGFAYLVDLPLTYAHEDVFGLCDSFFSSNGLTADEKMRLAKKTFVKSNTNTYRGYFPPQIGSDNLKEGFEIGPYSSTGSTSKATTKFNLAEPNVWPTGHSEFQHRAETLYQELQDMSARLLTVLAGSLGQVPEYFDSYLKDSLSTLRLLHYPPLPKEQKGQELICTPHTDSGILTVLHQDSTGGLEVLNSDGEWIAAPYIPGSVVVNIGDLMAKVSGGRWVATMHRVRAPKYEGERKGRYSVPFFFEPGMDCVVKAVGQDKGVVYGEHVLQKMKTWVEFQDVDVADGA